MDISELKQEAQERLDKAEAEAKAAKALLRALEGYERLSGPGEPSS